LLNRPPFTAVIAPFSKTRRIKHTDSEGTDASFVLDGRGLQAHRPAAVKKVNVVEHPIALHALTGLRNRQTGPEQFRAFSNQLLVLLAIEATRTLPAREETVETEVGPYGGRTLAKPVVFLAVSRHGLGLVHQVASFVPGALVGMINLGQAGHGQPLDPRLHLVNAPALSGVRVILFDPVVATGLSASVALDLLRRSGAVDVTLVSFLVSAVGLERVQAASPDLTVWTAAIDTEWDSKRGPLPGLGNFGERLYG
jgi:uracil phosphoribosyltransferase